MENVPGTRIVTLAPQTRVGTSEQPQIATFEEAFGEYSEIFGKKGRARRAKRRKSRRADKKARRTERRKFKNENKAEKVSMRDERKRNKADTRQKRRTERKTARQDMRLERRRNRQEQRANMRAERQSRRMQKRMERQAQKQARKDLKAQREAERERESMLAQQELDEMSYTDEPQGDDGYDDGGYDDSGYGEYDTAGGGSYDDYDPSDPYGDDDGYNPYADTQTLPPSSGSGYGEYDTAGGGSYDDYGDTSGGNWWEEDDFYSGDDDFDYEEDYGYDDGSWDDSGYEDTGDDYGWGGFDGDGEGEGEYMTGGGGSHSQVEGLQIVADKVEWNNELAHKLANEDGFSGFTGDKQGEAEDTNNRLSLLKEEIRRWVNFEDDEEYMGADGMYKKIPSTRRIMGRMRAVSMAKRNSRAKRPSVKAGKIDFKAMQQKRRAMRKARRKANPQAKGRYSSVRSRRRPGLQIKGAQAKKGGLMGKRIAQGKATKVEMGLTPQIQPQRIEIPASSNFDGDSKGKLSTVPIKEIAIGLAVGVAGVVLIKQLTKK